VLVPRAAEDPRLNPNLDSWIEAVKKELGEYGE
jgi:hypothetical protein